MNSRSENLSQGNAQQNSSLEQLMQANEEAMAALELIPYETVTYALPKGLRDAEMMLLEQAVQFQPTLDDMLSKTATTEQLQSHRKQMAGYMESYEQRLEKRIQSSMGQTLQETQQAVSAQTEALKKYNSQVLKEQTDSLLQAGSRREQNILGDTKEVLKYIRKADDFCSLVKQRLPVIAIAMVIVFMVLQPLAYMLWLKLLT